MNAISSPRTIAPSSRATRASVDLAAIAHNLRVIRGIVGPAVEVMAVLKADAYGHGAVAVARACLEAGATWIAVATVDEGVALRRAGITAPLLVLAPAVTDEYSTALEHRLTLAIGSASAGATLAALARAREMRASIHIEVDSGLSRFGIPVARAVEEVVALAQYENLLIQGIYTHLATAEESDKSPARAQLSCFDRLLAALEQRSITVGLRHAANSAAALTLPEACYDLVRPGLALYGYHPAGRDAGAALGLRPALSLRTQLVRVERVPVGTGVSYNHTFRATRPTVLGLVPLGYADGLPLALSNNGYVLVRGQRCPIVGRVCMDQTVLDLTDLPAASVGETVVIVGADGADAIDADELGCWGGTTVYDTLCRLSPRVPRDYV